MREFLDYIRSKSKNELEEELEELFSKFATIRKHYDLKLGIAKTEEIKLPNLKRYKTKIHQALNPDSNWQGGFDIEEVGKILFRLKNKAKIKYYLELGLYSLEECTGLANAYGGDYGEEFYKYFVELYHDLVKLLWAKGLELEYQIRITEIMEHAFRGYDYQDDLRDIYNKYYVD